MRHNTIKKKSVAFFFLSNNCINYNVYKNIKCIVHKLFIFALIAKNKQYMINILNIRLRIIVVRERMYRCTKCILYIYDQKRMEIS